METEKRVCVQIVQGGPRTKPVVGEFRMSFVPRKTILFPFRDVGVRDILVSRLFKLA